MSKKDRIRKNEDVPANVPDASGNPVIDYREVGATGLRRFSGFIYEEFLPELTGWKGVAIYKEMAANDATVFAIDYAIRMLCRRVKWNVEAGGKTAEDHEAAEFLESCMGDMSTTWIDMIDEALSMLVYGYSVHEIVYKRRCGDVFDPSMRSKYQDGRIGWRKIPIRSQDTIYRWQFDDHGGIQGVEQLAPPHYYHVTIPVEKFLLFRTTVTKNNPEGRSIFRGAYRCFSADTELLTDSGWRLVGEITTEDAVATLNRDTGAVIYEQPSETQAYPHKGEMIHAQSRYVDQLVTPNHRMWVRSAHKAYFEFIEASECKTSVNFSAGGEFAGGQSLKQVHIAGEMLEPNRWLAFLGVWLAEGSTSRQKGYDCGEVSLCQKEGPKADEIRKILASLPWSFSEATDENGMVRWRYYKKDLWAELNQFGKAKDKFIPREILNGASREQLGVLLDAYYLGDGVLINKTDSYAGTKKVSTVSDQLADDLMEAALKVGYRATKRWHQTEGFGVGCWMVTLGKQFTDRMNASWSSVDYDGMVYCVTTENGVVLSRRNGKATWSGNSWYMKKNIENIEAIGVERDLAGLPVAFVPPEILSPNASLGEQAVLAAIKTMTINVRRNEQEGMVFPLDYDANGKPRYDFKLLSTGGSRQFNTNDIVNRYDQRIAMTALADFILLGQDKVGSFALASSKTNLFATAIGAFLDIITETFNRYAIPRLFALNDFQVSDYPRIAHGDLGATDLKEIGAYILQLTQAGMPLFPNPEVEKHFLDIAGIPNSMLIDGPGKELADAHVDAQQTDDQQSQTEIPALPVQTPTLSGIEDRTPVDQKPPVEQVVTNIDGNTEMTSRVPYEEPSQPYNLKLGPQS